MQPKQVEVAAQKKRMRRERGAHVVWMGLHEALAGQTPASSMVMPASASLLLQTMTQRFGVVEPESSRMHWPWLVTPAGTGGQGEEVLQVGEQTGPLTCERQRRIDGAQTLGLARRRDMGGWAVGRGCARP